MGVLKYIPKKKFVVDKRTDDGGYYDAVCDECGNEFYPLRSSAKYCSRSCQVMHYRKNLKPKKTTEQVFVSNEVYNGVKQLIIGLKPFIKHGDTMILKDNIKYLKLEAVLKYDTFLIKRISSNKYAVQLL
jgi:hypothetical protein